MWAYWLLFLVPAGIALSPIKGDKNVKYMLWATVGLLCILLIGLRYQVGGDWDNYLGFLDNARGRDLSLALLLSRSYGNATAYVFLNWVALEMGFGGLSIYFVNIFCATIFMVGLIKYCHKQPMPWIALAVAIPYMVSAIAMGYTRQATALGFLLWGLSILRAGNEFKYFVLILVGCTFHLTLIITFPLLIFTRGKILWYYYPLFGLFLFGAWTLLSNIELGNRNLVEAYQVVWQYTAGRYSAGGEIRTYLNALPVLMSLFFWNRIKMISTDYKIIKWMAIACIIAIPVLSFSFEGRGTTTLVDRLGVYLMPVQLALWSRLVAVQKTMLLRSIWASMIIAFYALILFVFFNYALHARFWLPYQMWPFFSEPIYPTPLPMLG